MNASSADIADLMDFAMRLDHERKKTVGAPPETPVPVSDPTVATTSGKWLKKITDDLIARGDRASWRDMKTFWPPRCVEAFCENKATVFFGAGVSFPAGFPNWNGLLVEYFKLDRNFVEDDELKNDPLTLAELAAQVVGNEQLQEQLRIVFDDTRPPEKFPATSHYLLAHLRCKLYVTTNYDALFEKAWKELWNEDISVVTNQAALDDALETIDGKREGSVLFKIHGCISKKTEHLILTRRDYRYHYRANFRFFEKIIQFLRHRHTLFVGFSHRDPEVSRLVEDAIHQFETEKRQEDDNGSARIPAWPQLYSLQFDMRMHTPEIFAARGIVALTPPPVLDADGISARSISLALGLADLVVATTLKAHKSEERLDTLLSAVATQLQQPLHSALVILKEHADQALAQTTDEEEPLWLTHVRDQLGELASQGVFIANGKGRIVASSFPVGLNPARGKKIRDKGVKHRPYFQIAHSFRGAFVSDLAPSMFNDNGTFFLCQPLLKSIKSRLGTTESEFAGLIFCASQIGQWKLPIEIARKLWNKDFGMVLVDSNGVCLMPAFDEFPPKSVTWRADEKDATEDDYPQLNIGYPYQRLVGLSRRDELVRHIAKSVVPVHQDDDVFQLASDSSYYTVVTEITKTRWKLAISRPMTR